jgi:ABC-type oligopeptide transport system ATPase subunit
LPELPRRRREKTLDFLLQAFGLLSEFAGRAEHQFGGVSHLA